jgi:hypothetical protein
MHCSVKCANSCKLDIKSDPNTPSDTLNRLFNKNIKDVPELSANAPKLSAENTAVVLESWPNARLREIAPREESRTPKMLEPPLAILNTGTKFE